MRQDILRVGQLHSYPSDSSNYGYAEHGFADVARACDIWLKKRFPEVVPRKFGEVRRSMPRMEFGKQDSPFTESASTSTGSVHVPRDKKPKPPKKPKWKKPSAPKYASDEERAAAIRAIVKAHWASLTPEQRAARSHKSNSNRPKRETPRWLDPAYRAYKREWARKRKETHPLSEEELQKRREYAKAKYYENREQCLAKLKERRDRAKAAKEAAQKAGI